MKTKLSLFMVVLLAVVNAAHGYYDERNPTLVAYWPLNDGTNGQAVTVADDIVDSGAHPATNAVAEGSGGYWTNDVERGIVYRTVEGERLDAGTQGIDLTTNGFTWSLWVNVATNQNDDTGSDVIIGSRNGIWNKLQPVGWARWVSIGGYDLVDGLWHHVAAVGTTEPRVSLYIDGVLFGSTTTFDFGLVVDDKLELGGSSKYSEDLTGFMSDVAIWNEALSEERIQELAGGGSVIIGPPAGTVLIVK